MRVSAITIQKILNDNGLGTRIDRWLALETANAGKAIEITPEQAAFLEKLNPCFRERHVESSAPGELLSADTFFVGSLKGVGKVYLHAVVDTFGSYAFGFLHVSKQPEAAVAVLHNDVLPFYRNLDLPVGAILTDNGREFCGTERHPYELYLDLNGIEHRRTRVRTPRTNGFVERFNGTVLDEFFRVKMRETFYDTVEALQADLDTWLVHYNTERPHLGYQTWDDAPWKPSGHSSAKKVKWTDEVHRPVDACRARLTKLVCRKAVNSTTDISPEAIANSRCLIRPEPPTWPSIFTALQAGPGLDQRAVHREVLARKQPLHLRQGKQLRQKTLRHLTREQPVAVLGEAARVPHRLVHPKFRRTRGTRGRIPAAPSADAPSVPSGSIAAKARATDAPLDSRST